MPEKTPSLTPQNQVSEGELEIKIYCTYLQYNLLQALFTCMCRYNFLPDIILLTQGYYHHRGTRLNAMYHGRRGKGMAESFSRQKSSHAPQKEGGLKILCDLPPV